MPDRKHPDLVPRDDESVQRDVARLAEGNHELSHIAVHAPNKLPSPRLRPCSVLTAGQAFYPGMHVVRAIHLAGPLDLLVGRQCFLGEAAECSKRFRSNSGHSTGAFGPKRKFVTARGTR
jgi:hypothetical protein